MASCPWCKAPIGDLLAPCPRCGRTADEQGDGAAAGPDVPDLDLPAPKPRAAPAAQAKPAVRAAPAAASSAAKIPAAGAASAPKVAAAAAAAANAKAARQSRSDTERQNNAFSDPGARNFETDDDGESMQIELAAADAPAPKPAPPPPPVVKEEKPSEEEVSKREARALADYGDAPEAWHKTPLYAYRVLRRRKELSKVAAQKHRDAERAVSASEDAMVAFAELVRPSAERFGGSYDLAFEAVRATERVLGQRDAVLASETDAHNQRKAEIDAKLSEQETALTQIQMEERQAVGEVAEAEALLRRAEARLKQVEIEIRNVTADMQASAGPAEKGPQP